MNWLFYDKYQGQGSSVSHWKALHTCAHKLVFWCCDRAFTTSAWPRVTAVTIGVCPLPFTMFGSAPYSSSKVVISP